MFRRRPARCADPDTHNRDLIPKPPPFPRGRLFGLLPPPWPDVWLWACAGAYQDLRTRMVVRHAIECPVSPALVVDPDGVPTGAHKPGWRE